MGEEKTIHTVEPKPGDDRWRTWALPETRQTVKGLSWLVNGNNGRIIGLVEPSFKAPKGFDAILVRAKKSDQYPRISQEKETDGELIVDPKTAERVLAVAAAKTGKKASI